MELYRFTRSGTNHQILNVTKISGLFEKTEVLESLGDNITYKTTFFNRDTREGSEKAILIFCDEDFELNKPIEIILKA